MTQRRINLSDYQTYFLKGLNDMKIILKNVRLAFPDLFVATPYKPGDEPKYKATFLIPKGGALAKEIEAAINEVGAAKWGAKSKATLDSIRSNPNKFCYQDGDLKDYDGYAGMMALSAKNKARPLVVDKDKTPLDSADGRPYAGCYVDASVEIFAYTNSGNGISASLRGVRFLRDGDAFAGGAPASPDEFEDLSTEDDLA